MGKIALRGKKSRGRVVVRLTRIVTRTGDRGTTGLSDGSRVSKSHARVEAMGSVDELNAWIGLLRSRAGVRPKHGRFLGWVQNSLFDLGAGLSRPLSSPKRKGPPPVRISPSSLSLLEKEIAALSGGLPPLTSFILPGGSEAACLSHLARTVCRRAERRVTALARKERCEPLSLVYLNRLSDYLFILSRDLNRGLKEPLWKPLGRS